MPLYLLLAEPSTCSSLYVMISAPKCAPTHACCAVTGRVEHLSCPTQGEWVGYCTAEPCWCGVSRHQLQLACTKASCNHGHYTTPCMHAINGRVELFHCSRVGYTAQQSKLSVCHVNSCNCVTPKQRPQPHYPHLPCLNVTRPRAAAMLLQLHHGMPTMQPAMHDLYRAVVCLDCRWLV